MFSCATQRSGALRIKPVVPLRADGRQFRINLYNQKGRFVTGRFDGSLAAGNKELTVCTVARVAGQYHVELRSKEIRRIIPVVLTR
ncbi:MAG: hypothetical protein JW863_11555 [Chitinispirillaceae bacterium]|nr:hypothetical protein [Chitinispirillaceae bacterium]